MVAGSTGLVGSSLMRILASENYIVQGISRKICDLREYSQTLNMLEKFQPDIIIDSAARVGGIADNNKHPVEFLENNLLIQNNLMKAAHMTNVKKFVFLGSSCIYPKLAPQPITEECLMTGPLEKTNSAYSIAKIAGLELIKAYRREYGKRWIALMPTNVYGPGDKFDEFDSHVIPALILKFLRARDTNQEKVIVWGKADTRREFIFSEDLARAIFLCSKVYEGETALNVGSGQEITIGHLATLIANLTSFEGIIEFDESALVGTPRKLLDSNKINKLGWRANVSLEEGIARTISWYESQRGQK